MTHTEAQTSPSVLELHKVGRQFGSDPAVHALVDVDLRLEPGEWLTVTGPPGAGKSTLLNVIGCLDTPTSDSYFFDGIDTATLSDKERAGPRSQRIGFVFQSFHLLPHRSVLENAMLAEVYRKQSRQGRRERALAAIDKVGLSHRPDFLPTKLSGGEKQRVAIARAIVGSPSLLLCDEPTGNLDSKSSANILDLFEDLNRNGECDAGERGIAGLTLALEPVPAQALGVARARTTTTDGQGFYRFEEVAPGTYLLSLQRPAGYWPTAATVLAIGVGPHESLGVNFDLYWPPVHGYLPTMLG